MLTKLIKLLAPCLFLFFTLSAQANTFNRVVVFGDSLSDNGNLFKASGLPEKPYFDGRFSNGTVWIELIAQALNLNLDENTKQFADYAYGGAWAADTENGEGGLVPLSFERTLYFADYPAHSIDEKNTLFVIWIGNNDYLQDGRLNENAETVTQNTVQAIETHINELIGAGAEHFLIINLPDLGQTPKAKQSIAKGHPEYAANISLLSHMHNTKLTNKISEIANIHPEIEFKFFDLATHFNDLTQHPEKYNIKEVTNPCFPTGFGQYEEPLSKLMSSKTLAIKGKTIDLKSSPDLMNFYRLTRDGQQSNEYCANTNDYLFWDYVHPTAYAHMLIAEFVMEMVAKN